MNTPLSSAYAGAADLLADKTVMEKLEVFAEKDPAIRTLIETILTSPDYEDPGEELHILLQGLESAQAKSIPHLKSPEEFPRSAQTNTIMEDTRREIEKDTAGNLIDPVKQRELENWSELNGMIVGAEIPNSLS